MNVELMNTNIEEVVMQTVQKALLATQHQFMDS